MSITDRYIAQAISLYSLLVMAVLIALDRIFSFIRQLDDIGKGTYDIAQLLVNIVLHTPSSVYELAPTAVLLGALLGLGALANRSELIVMRSMGMSVVRLARPLMLTGVMIAGVLFSMGEWVIPQSEEAATRLRQQAMSQSVSMGGASGLWLREGERYINVRRVLPGLNLRGVSIYEYRNRQINRVIRAESAHFNEAAGWILSSVDIDTFELSDTFEVKTLDRQEKMPSPVELQPNLLIALALEPNMLSSRELYANIRYLDSNQLETRSYELAFWSKFSLPLSTFVMLLLALPFVLGLQRNTSAGKRIFLGSLVGIAYILFSQVSSQLGLLIGVNGAIGAFFPLILFFIAASIGIKRLP
ncbi:MAG: LPS export ABC transporter permease LptG [Pseudomonadota bacterium]